MEQRKNQHERLLRCQESAASADHIQSFACRRRKRNESLRRAACVAVMEAADLRQVNNPAVFRWLDCTRLGRLFFESEMCARPVVVAEVIAKTASQVLFVQHNYVVEELAPNRTDYPLDEGILPGRARCGENLGDADALHPSAKLAAVDAVSITEEIARSFFIREGLDDLLRGPGGSGRVGHVEVHDSTPMMHQHHEHVEHAKGRRRYDEEVDGDEVGEVVLKEGSPGLRGRLPTAGHETGNGALRDAEPKLEQLAMDAGCAPECSPPHSSKPSTASRP